jgi:hypothetical protein
MNPNDVIESYVADVIRRVPLKERNDIGFELHTLLTEMLDERAQEAGKPADDAMVLAMLREFGAPADLAARYRAPGGVIIPPEQTRSFAWLSLSGIALQWAVSLPRVAEGEQSLTAWWLTWGLGAFWWPGFLSMMSLIVAWIRQWRPGDAAWTPREVDPDRVNRGAMAIGVVSYALAVAMMLAMPAITSRLPAPFPGIFEFARELEFDGRTPVQAAIEASRLRLRPILMTSLAFIMGVLPLAISTGAGANARHAIGTGVIGGMLAATFLGLLFIPVFYAIVRRALGDKLDEPPKLTQHLDDV